eukprot:5836468-Prymnesium_polylepis.1
MVKVIPLGGEWLQIVMPYGCTDGSTSSSEEYSDSLGRCSGLYGPPLPAWALAGLQPASQPPSCPAAASACALPSGLRTWKVLPSTDTAHHAIQAPFHL